MAQTKAERQASGQKAAATRQKNEAQDERDRREEGRRRGGRGDRDRRQGEPARPPCQAGKSVSNRAKARKG